MIVNAAFLIEMFTVVLQLVLAGTLLYLNPRNVANRALALVLVMRAGLLATWELEGAVEDPVWRLTWGAMAPYFAAGATGIAILAFALLYPRPRGPFVRMRAPLTPFVVLIVGIAVAYVWRHDLWLASDGEAGVLFHLGTYSRLAYPVAALLFLREFTRSRPGRLRRSLLIMSAGFTLIHLHDELVAAWVGASASLLDPWAGSPPLAAADRLQLLLFAALVPLALVWSARTEDEGVRRGLHAFLWLLLLPVATASAVVVSGSERAASLMQALWDPVLPVLVTYALLRHQLFDIDVRVKWTIRQSTLAGIFIAVFFVVSESSAAFFSGRVGTYAGILAAGALVFAIVPLQHLAQRVANAAMPGVKAVGEMTSDERLGLYRRQLETAWADGNLSADERDLLGVTREQLGIGADDALRLEREVTRR